MAAKTPFFRAFGPLLFGRAAPAAGQKLKRLNSLQELYELFGHLLPEHLLAPAEKGPGSRERIFSTQVTFWVFAAQILSPGTSCREIVRRVEAWWQERHIAGHAPSRVSDSAYCQAGARLDGATLELIRVQLAWSLERNVLEEESWVGDRPVKIIDGTGISMPDTPENQALWPQPAPQQPGCGFPLLKLAGLFSLASGALLEAATGNLHVQENTSFGASVCAAGGGPSHLFLGAESDQTHAGDGAGPCW
jgi:hypothetical protein